MSDLRKSALYHNSRSLFFGLLLFFIVLIFSLPCRAESSSELNQKTAGLIDNGAYILSRNNQVAAACNPDTLFSPASIWKIAVSAEALHILGHDYRFTTDFYFDSRQNLYVKGHGDPLLISEKINDIAILFKEKGVRKINSIFLDDTAFKLAGSAAGAGNSLNPYDAANCALAVNFNTIFLEKKANGTIISAEEQTPMLPLMAEKGKNLKPGRHRITIAHQADDSMRLSGQLLRAMLETHGICCVGKISRSPAPPELPLFYRHYSPPVSEIIGRMLLYSNNFMANQLFLVCGAEKYGSPATWEKGKKTLNNFLLKEIGLNKENFQVEEGSGLSRKNKITARAMLKVLDYFQNNRLLLDKKNGLLIKSGTLSNVFSYAGYQPADNGLNSFVIILNQEENNRDEILHLLLRF